MITLIKIAWRNIWRNKKRTVLTMLSIVLAIFLSLFTRSMQLGTFGSMIDNAVKLSTGYIQIHKPGYWENKSINESFYNSDSINILLRNIANIKQILPRIESFALASSGEHTKGVLIKGIIPHLEDQLNQYSQKILKGEYLRNEDKSILIGDELARFLQIDVDDSLVLLGQGYHGVTAAAQYPVKGIIHFPIPELSRQLVIMPLTEAQYFYGLENRLTSISLMIIDPELLENTFDNINMGLSNNYEIMTWEEMNKELVQFIDTKLIGGKIMLSILYLVVGFGVFGTIMMMAMERRKEFAIMVSIGLRKVKLITIILWEIVLIGLVAILIGIFLAYPLLTYLSNNPIVLTGEFAESMKSVGADPIMPFVNKPSIYLNQSISIIILTLFAIIYPLLFILRFNLQKAMRA